MKVITAEYAGACYGVQRALNMARDSLSGNMTISSLGPLIHNPIVVSQLEKEGISVAHTVDEIQTEAVLIRSHGITPQLRDEIDARGLHAIDATCPYVLRAQKAAEKLALEHEALIIVGQGGHPEVEALEAYVLLSNNNVFVVERASELPGDLPTDVGVVVQTTQTTETLEDVLEGIELHHSSNVVANTICTATCQRQEAARIVASQVDAMVVIGGRNSANTNRLAEICLQQCEKTYLIESKDELKPAWFDACSVVGVTAGASTPQSQIDEVTTALQNM